MSVRALDSNGDWTFGRGKAQLLTRSDEVAQNVVTRIKSFKDDWYLDIEAEIDWFTILGIKGNEEIIVNEISRVVLATTNVKSLVSVEILSNIGRNATIEIKYIDIWDNETLKEIAL